MHKTACIQFEYTKGSKRKEKNCYEALKVKISHKKRLQNKNEG